MKHLKASAKIANLKDGHYINRSYLLEDELLVGHVETASSSLHEICVANQKIIPL